MPQNQESLVAQYYEAIFPKLIKIAYRLTDDMAIAEDLVQDTFTIALFRQDRFASSPNPEGWLVLTLRNLIKNELRHRRNEEVPLDGLFRVPSAGEPQRLWESLPSQLSAEERSLLTWRYEDGLCCREIADRLGITETACRSRVFRALRRYRSYAGLPAFEQSK